MTALWHSSSQNLHLADWPVWRNATDWKGVSNCLHNSPHVLEGETAGGEKFCPVWSGMWRRGLFSCNICNDAIKTQKYFYIYLTGRCSLVGTY